MVLRDDERILEGLARRDPAALARAITLVENQRDGFEQVLSHAHSLLGRAVRGGSASPVPRAPARAPSRKR